MSPPDGTVDLLVIGDCNPDVLVLGDDVTPEFGQQEKLVAGISLVIGGSGSITAVAASAARRLSSPHRCAGSQLVSSEVLAPLARAASSRAASPGPSERSIRK